ncbi:MAG: gliding motility lipoprotein GldH [Salibacteraceae bacterium]
MLCTACDSNRVYETNQPLDGEVWPIQKTVRFSVNISDTVSSHALLFNVRNSGRYAYSNLYTYLTTEYPDNRIELDTLEFVLAAPDGKWLGSGLGDIYDNQILFARNVRFPVPGEYTFEFVQGMRVDQLTHLLDVGLRIEREE